MDKAQKIKNCKKIKNLLLSEGIDLHNDEQYDDYIDNRVDGYFLGELDNKPDPKLFPGCEDWDGQTSWCGYFTFVVEDCFNDFIPSYDVTDRDVQNVENLLKVTRR
jgi:hypothetical protein